MGEGCLILKVRLGLLLQVLQPVQVATFLVTLHPTQPDLVVLMNEIAKEQGDGDMIGVLELGSSESFLIQCKQEKAIFQPPAICRSC